VSKTRPMTAAPTWVMVALAGLLLTGCGSASPGVAVKVGDEEISTRHVDEVTANYCTAVGELESAVPMGFVRQYTVQLLTLRSQASQIADDYGVEPGSTYYNDVAQRQAAAETQPEEVRDDYVELASTSAYAQDIPTRSVASSWRSGASPTRPPSRPPRPASTCSTSGPTPTTSRSTRASACATSTAC
jgi:hypothetical protein